MKVSRLDLDGIGAPAALAARIHQIESDLPLAVPVEELCCALDITSIEEIHTLGFEAALIMDAHKAAGSILVASGRSPQRRRYSVCHELGHFLIPTHLPRAGEEFSCSLDDLHMLDGREADRRRRIEAEANRFAAALLMPPSRIRANLASAPDLREIVRLARAFDVSKEAMARAYVDASREAVALLILQHGRIERVYRRQELFPWIVPRIGRPVPVDSLAARHGMVPGECSDMEDCDPTVWLGERDAAGVEQLTEQLLGQSSGFAMLLLHAEFDEDAGED